MDRISPKRTVELVGAVKEESIKAVIGEIREMIDNDPDGWVQLNIISPGGEVSSGFALYDFIMANKVRLRTVAMGHAHSMAVPLFLAGEHRVFAQRAIMLLHELSQRFDMEVRLDLTEIRRLHARLEHQQQQYIGVIVERTAGKLTAEAALVMMREDTILTSVQALALGIAHEIIA